MGRSHLNCPPPESVMIIKIVKVLFWFLLAPASMAVLAIAPYSDAVGHSVTIIIRTCAWLEVVLCPILGWYSLNPITFRGRIMRWARSIMSLSSGCVLCRRALRPSRSVSSSRRVPSFSLPSKWPSRSWGGRRRSWESIACCSLLPCQSSAGWFFGRARTGSAIRSTWLRAWTKGRAISP